MSTIRVAVPVLLGRRRFIFDKGRPWSIIEHAILAVLTKQEAECHELATRSALPSRVVVESLVRLMRVGWRIHFVS